MRAPAMQAIRQPAGAPQTSPDHAEASPSAPPLDPATAERLAAARRDGDEGHRLAIGELEVGQWGVLEAMVQDVGRTRVFSRKRGGEGMLRRILIADGTGEIDLVLWDEECRLAEDGPLAAGAQVRLHGPEVRPGYRGGLELHLGAAHIRPVTASSLRTLEGELVAVGEGRIVGEPPAVRFNADVRLRSDGQEVCVVLWDEGLRVAREVLPGTRLRVTGARPHPAIDDWYLGDGARVQAR